MSKRPRRESRASRMGTTWFLFWEGVLIGHFFGLWVAAAWCLAFLLLALGVQLGRKSVKR